jgi:hypothetical protein
VEEGAVGCLPPFLYCCFVRAVGRTHIRHSGVGRVMGIFPSGGFCLPCLRWLKRFLVSRCPGRSSLEEEGAVGYLPRAVSRNLLHSAFLFLTLTSYPFSLFFPRAFFVLEASFAQPALFVCRLRTSFLRLTSHLSPLTSNHSAMTNACVRPTAGTTQRNGGGSIQLTKPSKSLPSLIRLYSHADY